MGKVADKILEEANQEKKRMIQAAKKKAAEIIHKASLEAKKIKENGGEEAERVKKREMERYLSKVRLSLKALRLKAKNEVIDELKEQVKMKMKELNWSSEYKPFIESQILCASNTNDEEIIPGSLFKEEFGALVKSLNEKKKCNFTISEEKGDFELGIILKKDKKRMNLSFPVFLEEAMYDLEERVVKLLFGSE